ncbi:aminotransferase class I/II-fold pyridoxal phosphate-dependent enzyme [Candidatus Peregrinibacteria bacterium]|nr:aminotransferase class I/II-fold pyridoxal phosphate-dependent enzyme [Candidatus Peregrinibacteria bacterium]
MDFIHLPKTSLAAALSAAGKKIELPKGIFYWSARAKAEAEIDGTIGIAQDDDGTVSHLPMAEDWAGAKVMQKVPKAKIFGYAPVQGVESLRKKWLAKALERHPVLKNHATVPVVTNGITHSLALAGKLLLNPGETLVTADKSWENYEHIFGTLGVSLTHFKLFREDLTFNVENIIEVCEQVAAVQKKMVLLLNFPHNQTGFMPSKSDFERLGGELHKLCTGMPGVPFVILLDDAYEGYVYDEVGLKFSPASALFALLPNLTLVKMDGISKVMLAYGYRVGFLTFCLNSLDGKVFGEEFLRDLNGEIGSKIGGFIRAEISQVNHHGQVLADALMDDPTTLATQRGAVIKMLQERFEAMMAAVKTAYAKYGDKKLKMLPCNGGFFCYFSLAPGIDAKNIGERLLKEKKIGIVPSDGGLRVAFTGVPKSKIERMVNGIFEVVCG